LSKKKRKKAKKHKQITSHVLNKFIDKVLRLGYWSVDENNQIAYHEPEEPKVTP
jgi:hypothetical protein